MRTCTRDGRPQEVREELLDRVMARIAAERQRKLADKVAKKEAKAAGRVSAPAPCSAGGAKPSGSGAVGGGG
eukprot:212147-Chlamydomonas_euryale.AAC.1